ncbi:hypothetical protein BCR34DRAFT_355411 [Clohesyomyces aquaticus]|uniref:Uncharacterized protein n=1 Tax=Clohesyomyces aquaticus TaxID=1231657 RepID=A0A1Y1ZK44_9PLEO|nr:hypothetical protein BCR34DRAFT_355411 [Clohesyomyces aquaticus]
MSCPFEPGFSIAPNVTYAQFNSSFADHIQCPNTYLRRVLLSHSSVQTLTVTRPDPGGALIPWLYAVFLLIFHLPACIVRAVRWESAQYLALGLAVLGIALTTQSFESTGLQAGMILVWMPLTLVLDVGAMLQMVVLIIEKYDDEDTSGLAVLWRVMRDSMAGMWAFVMSACLPKHRRRGGRREQANVDAFRHAVVAFVAFILLLILLVLQIRALVAAVQGRNHAQRLTVKWCSPAFRDFALGITTGDCNLYGIVNSSSNGIGCIALPAVLQDQWLTGTIICLSGALVCQVVDMILLRCAHGRKCRGVRMQRPWLTMFGGVIMLILLITLGVFNANRLPEGVTSKVWIYRKEPMALAGRVCQTHLTSPGLRGMIIGWTDGLFEAWGSVYEGSVANLKRAISS